MTQRINHSQANQVQLRPVVESDLPILFEHQRESEANAMAAFPARDLDAFMVDVIDSRVELISNRLLTT